MKKNYIIEKQEILKMHAVFVLQSIKNPKFLDFLLVLKYNFKSKKEKEKLSQKGR